MNTLSGRCAPHGSKLIVVLFLLAAPLFALAETVVVPKSYENIEATGGSSVLNDNIRLQEIYDALDLPAGPIIITEIRLRPSATYGWAFTNTIGDIVVRLSTSTVPPGGLHANFAQNVGTNETVVFSGALSLNSSFAGPATGPKAFDIAIPLTTPFLYDPALGHLLVDFKNISGSAVTYVDAGPSLNHRANRAFALGADSPTATAIDFGADVIQLVHTPAPVPPLITQQPTDLTATLGEQAIFGAAARSAVPLFYQWHFNGTEIAGAVAPILALTSVTASDAGSYSVVITNQFGSVTSRLAALTIAAVTNAEALVVPPSFKTQEAGGGSSSLFDKIRLQEVYDASLFPAGTIRITALRFRPSAGFGQAFSTTITNLQINLSTTTREPGQLSSLFASNVGADDQIVFQGALSISSAFTGPANGPKDFDIVVPLSTLFYYNSSQGNLLLDIRNASGSSAAPVDSGIPADHLVSRVFAVNADSTAGASDSGADVLQVVYELIGASPVITEQPAGRTANPGEAITFSVAATSPVEPSYHWLFNGSAVPGGNGTSLLLTNVGFAHAGAYAVVVSNQFGSVTSSNAVLTVNVTTNASQLVIHPGFANQEGGGGSSSLVNNIRLQEVYAASMFPPGPILISQLRFRPSAPSGHAFTATIGNIQLNLSTTPKQPGQLAPTFSSNVGSNDQIVFQGALSISSAFVGPAGGPKNFDIIVPLSTPFLYDPSQGNLLLDIRNFSGSTATYVDAGLPSDQRTSRVFALGAGSQNGLSDGGADVLQILYTIAPNPPVITTQPASQHANEGTTATLTVGANIAGSSLRFQWYFGGTPVANATESSLVISNAQFSDAGDYFVTVSNSFGSVTSQVATLTVDAVRTLAIMAASPRPEGAMISALISLESHGDVGGMTFLLRYNTNDLKNVQLKWPPALEGLFNSVNYSPTGQVRATFALANSAVPAGTQVVASVEFLLRSVPHDLDTVLQLEIVDVSDPLGDPLAHGNLSRNESVHITRRTFVGDNNANQRLDVGDATVILSYLAGLEQTRDWDVTGNDVNSSGNLDSGDAIKVLRAAAGVDPQPGGGGFAPAGNSPGPTMLPVESLELSPATVKVAVGGSATFQVLLRNIRSAISGTSFTLEYPTNALRLLTSQDLRTGAIVPGNALSLWNVAPAINNFTVQNGRITFAASSAATWAASNGVLAELTFKVEPGATNRYAAPLLLRNSEITPNGYQNRFLYSGSAAVTTRDPVPGRITAVSRNASGIFQFTFDGDQGARYLIEASTNLTTWSVVTNFYNGSGLFNFSDPLSQTLPKRFYRVHP